MKNKNKASIESKMNKQILTVDVDLIRHLRKTGKGIEATKMLNAYQDQTKLEKKRIKQETINKDRKIKKALNICIATGCPKPICENSVCYCLKHHEKNKEYHKK